MKSTCTMCTTWTT